MNQKSLKDLLAQEIADLEGTPVESITVAEAQVAMDKVQEPVVAEPIISAPVIEKPKKEKPVSDTDQKNAFRDNPEAFFGPVIAALVASGVQKDGIRPRAIAAYWNCLDLCDWVKDGGAADAWVLERKYKACEKKQIEKDAECQRVKIEHDKYKAKLVSTDPDAAERPTLTTRVADLKQKYQALEIESLDLLRQKTELQGKRLVS